MYENCTLCPRMCRTDRRRKPGLCGQGTSLKAARAALHFWEEPCLSEHGGSGAVFFSGCTLRCCYCQNYKISQEGLGKEISPERLGEIFLSLQDKGARNIDLITATHFLPSILPVLDKVKPYLHIPVVYNCGGYERVETLRMLEGYVDIYLPDLKYFSREISRKYSGAPDYFQYASQAIPEMIRQCGKPILDKDGMLVRGVLIRHMVLPGQTEDSIRLLHWTKENLPEKSWLISLMSQYTPFTTPENIPRSTGDLPLMNIRKCWTPLCLLDLIRDTCRNVPAQKKSTRLPLIWKVCRFSFSYFSSHTWKM